MIEAQLLQSPWPVIWWDEIDSTSVEASRRSSQGERGPIWLAARRQTAGRGRLGRPWQSPAGNLSTTLLLPLSSFDREASCLSLTVGLAVRDTLVELSQGKVVPGLKWPNDVRVDGAKICGILMEAGQTNGQHWLSIGIGVNLQYAPDLPDYATTSLMKLCPELSVSPEDCLTKLDHFVRVRLTQHLKAGRETILRDWMSATDQHGQSYRAQIGGKSVTGQFNGLDEYGQLILRTSEQELLTVSAGDLKPITESHADASGN
ncbi:MAG: biotin--[acetyl-CoA-carboxylase] ligase [Ponticaulis sp.]|nr:biotin--[acetyl-CoA-carboxylase] ligase [Ponticaulis sp.]|tara:strand:- start:69476 stop:70258 length:783 start_codon:yes stop_codon:yes gene_type:complete